MSLENTHKLMGFYMEGLILGVNTMYMFFYFFKLFLTECIGLKLDHFYTDGYGWQRVKQRKLMNYTLRILIIIS